MSQCRKACELMLKRTPFRMLLHLELLDQLRVRDGISIRRGFSHSHRSQRGRRCRMWIPFRDAEWVTYLCGNGDKRTAQHRIITARD